MAKTIKIKIAPTKVIKGHQAHRSGSGTHADRRTKRNRTRAAVNKKEIGSWS